MRDVAGSAAAPAARCRKVLRGSFILHLPLALHHSITSSASNWIELGTTGLPARSRAPWAGGGDKAQSLLRRNYLTGRDGDRINAVLAAAGYNFSLLLRWSAKLLAPSR